MSKLGLASVSLVAAIPGGFLVVLLVMTFLSNADKLSGMMWAMSVTTLLTSVLVAVIPVGVMLFGPKAESSDTAEELDGEDDSLADDDADNDDFSDDEELVADEGDELALEDEFDDDASETIDGSTEDLFMEEDDDDFGLELDEDED